MRKKKLYVVGYDTDDNCIYGNEGFRWIDPLTFAEAKKELKMFDKVKGFTSVIYKLVPVDPKELSRKKG